MSVGTVIVLLHAHLYVLHILIRLRCLLSLTPPLFAAVVLSESTSGQNIPSLWVLDYGRVSMLTFAFSSKNKSFPISRQNFKEAQKTSCAATVTTGWVVRLLLSIHINMLSTSSCQTWSLQNSVFVLGYNIYSKWYSISIVSAVFSAPNRVVSTVNAMKQRALFKKGSVCC